MMTVSWLPVESNKKPFYHCLGNLTHSTKFIQIDDHPVAACSQIFNFEKEPILQFLSLTSPLSSLILRAFAELFVE